MKTLSTFILLLAGCVLAYPALASEGPASRPCLVMPHPLKGQMPPVIGAPAQRAHEEDHAHKPDPAFQGVAERPIKRLNTIALMVDFEDQVMEKDQAYFLRVMEYVDQMYTIMSDGQLEIEYTVPETVFRLPETMAFYGDDDDIAGQEALLIRDAVLAADPTVDFNQYNSFVLFHAGPGQEADINNDSKEQIWSVFFRTRDLAFWLPDDDGVDYSNGIPTNDRTLGAEPVYVSSMVVAPETESQDGFDFGILGVTAHEYGHGFGLPDLYDTTAPDGFAFAESQGIGAFGLMGAGIWNANGFFPAEMCAWSKYYVGWLRPQDILRPTDGNTGGEVMVELDAIPINPRNGLVRVDLGGDEYFLIENRIRDYNGNGEFDFDDQDGDGEFDFGDDSYLGCEFDWHLPREPVNLQVEGADGSGLLIYHIDESILRERLQFNIVNAEADHKGVDLEEADGIQDLDQLLFTFEAFGDPKDAWYAPFATAFTPETTPSSNAYNEAQTSVWITDISGPGNTMSFKVRFGDFEPGWPRYYPGLHLARDFQPLVADLNNDGSKEIIACAVDDQGNGGPLVYRADGTGYFTGDFSIEPLIVETGKLNAAPVLTELGDNAFSPELVWVSGDKVYVMQGDGTFFAEDGSFSRPETGIGFVPRPVPFYTLPREPGRIELVVSDVNSYDRPEILIGERNPGGTTNITLLSYEPNVGLDPVFPFAKATYDEDVSLPGVIADVFPQGDGFLETVNAVRTCDGTGGYIAVGVLTQIPGVRDQLINPYQYAVGDSVAVSPPVVGDLDRDGILDIVFTDDQGRVHAVNFVGNGNGPATAPALISQDPCGQANFVAGNEAFRSLEGFPVQVADILLDTEADTDLSLVDIDQDGFLEILLFTYDNVFHAINYNGTHNLRLPYTAPGEDLFFEGFHSALSLDINGDGQEELVFPLRDGQVRGHENDGRPIAGWNYVGGGDQGIYPVIEDIDGDGMLELVTVEDVTWEIPDDTEITNGDLADSIVKRGRVVVREVGPAGNTPGTWPVYRRTNSRNAVAPAPTAAPDQPVAGMVDELFLMPNPARGTEARFHYKLDPDVRGVTIEIHDVAGNAIRTLTGTTLVGTDNLVRWDLANEQGSRVAPGLYVARVEIETSGGSRTEFLTFAVLR